MTGIWPGDVRCVAALSFDLDGVFLNVVDRETLIRTKQTIRPSDAADRAWLQAANEDEKP